MKRVKKRIIAFFLTLCMLIGNLSIYGHETSAATDITVDTLLYQCPAYLNNADADYYLTQCYNAMGNATDWIDSDFEVKFCYSYINALRTGSSNIVRYLASKVGLTDSKYDDINKKAAYQMLKDYFSIDDYNANWIKEMTDGYDGLKKVYDIYTTAGRTVWQENLENSMQNINAKDIAKTVSETFHDDNYKSLKKYASTGMEACVLVSALLEMQDMQIGTVKKMINMFAEDTDIRNGLEMVLYDMQNTTEYYFGNLFTNEILSKAAGNLKKNLVNGIWDVSASAYALANLVVSSMSTIAEKLSFSIEDYQEYIIYRGFAEVAGGRVDHYTAKFISGKGSTEDETLLEMAYNLQIIALKHAMKACVSMERVKQLKENIKKYAAELGVSFTYDKYINMCINSAKKAVKSGNLEISGNSVVNKTDDGTIINKNYDSTESVKAKLAVIMKEYPPNAGVQWFGSWGGCFQCFGFSRMVFSKLYGCEMPARIDSNALYRYTSSNNVVLNGQLVGGEVTTANLQSMFAKAKIGDVIQATGSKYGNHTMIFVGLNSSGITVYDCNSALNGEPIGSCYIHQWDISYNTLISYYSTGGISLYHAANYESIYGNGDDLFYDDSVNFVIDENGVLTKYNGWQAFVEIPDSVTAIGDYAFENNKTMMGVTIPDSVKSIGNHAFENCTSLLGIVIPDSVESIGVSAFSGCTSLASAKLPENKKFVILQNSVFYKCKSLAGINIPNSVTKIEGGAFSECSNLSTVTLSKSLTYLGGASFENCDRLTEIEIPKSLESCGVDWYGNSSNRGGPFTVCDNLKKVTFEQGTTEIAENLFYNCPGIEKIEIPDTVTTIENSGFKSCSSLSEVIIPDSVTKIEGGAFSECSNLSTVTLSKSLTYLGGASFENCDRLTEIEIPKSLESCGVDWYGNSSNRGGPFTVCDNLKKVTFEQGTTEIAENLFYNCPGIEKIEIPDTVTTIENSGFRLCSNLSEVTISDSVTKIESGAFAECTSLSAITIPNSVEKIGYNLFDGCSVLEKVSLSDKLTIIPSSIFRNCVKLNDIVLPEKITEIESQAFYNCNALKSIKIPDSVTRIGSSAFSECDSIYSITIPENVTSVGSSAFYNCDSLSKVVFSDSVEQIGSSIFKSCDMLSDVTLSAYLQKIPDEAFMDCPSLEKIVIPYRVTQIRSNAFKNDTKLTQVTIPKSVTSIDKTAFSYPKKLTISGVKGSYASTFATDNKITFKEIDVAGELISLNKNEVNLYPYDYEVLKVVIKPLDYTGDIVWSTSDETVVSVTQEGEIKALKTGSATITVKAGELESTCKVNVLVPVNYINVDTATVDIVSGESYQIKCSVEPENAANKNLLYSSEDETIATVDKNGLVSAIKKGSTYINIKSEDGHASRYIRINVVLKSSDETPAPTLTPTAPTTEVPSPTPTVPATEVPTPAPATEEPASTPTVPAPITSTTPTPLTPAPATELPPSKTVTPAPLAPTSTPKTEAPVKVDESKVITSDDITGQIQKIITDAVEKIVQVITKSAPKITEDAWNNMTEKLKQLEVSVANSDNELMYEWSFDSRTMSDKVQDTDLTVDLSSDNEITKEINTAVGTEDILVMDCAYKGDLPGVASVKVYVGNKFVNGDKVYAYRYDNISDETTIESADEKTVKLVSKDALEVKDGYVELNIDCGSTYFFTKELIKDTPVEEVNTEEKTWIHGDLDSDGKVSLNEVVTVLKAALGIEKITGVSYAKADFDEDGSIKLSDAQAALKTALGIK